MPSARFTARWIQSLRPPEHGQVDYFDTRGIGKGRSFGLRVSYGGKKSWFVMYRKDGKLRRLTIGDYSEYGLKEARDKADGDITAIIEGRDPAAEKQAEKTAETVSELADAYIEKYAKRRKKSWQRDKEILDRDVVPAWGDRKVKDIKRVDVIDLLEAIADRGAGILANRTLAVIRKMYNWGIEREIVENNPCYLVKRPAKENRRERVLTDGEIKKFWKNIKSTNSTEPTQIVSKLILVTAQRKGEIINASKTEFDLKGKWWTIPGGRTKNGLSHHVPLSPLAIDLVKHAIKLSGDSKFLFPSPREDKPILASAVDMAVRRNRDKFKIDHFTPHDLRRTAASHMTSMGITRLVVSKILNHAESGITAIYDRHSYDQEKRSAIDSWARKLQTIIKGRKTEKVVKLRA